MKRDFLALALEEAGLVTTPTEPVVEKSFEEFEKEQDEEGGEIADKAEELEKLAEVQEGLEALVASMEAAVVDQNYSLREYRLQVSHAQLLLGKLNLGLPSGLSCESTEGAHATASTFADKAKKLGQAVIEYAKKFLEWLQTTLKAGLARSIELFKKIASKQNGKGSAGVKYEVVTVWEDFEFDPKNPTKYTDAALKFLEEYHSFFSSKVAKLMATYADGTEDEETKLLEEYNEDLKQFMEGKKLPYELVVEDEGGWLWYEHKTRDTEVKPREEETSGEIDTAKAIKTFEKAENDIGKFEGLIKSLYMKVEYKVLGDAETVCKWLYDVFTTESKVAMAYTKASLSA